MAARDFRFSKSRRLTRTSDFKRVKKEGGIERGRLLALGFLVFPDATFRAGFVTSRGVGGAVVRNRVRRRLREIIRQDRHLLRPDIWIVLIARPPAERALSRDLRDEWLRLAKRAFILAA